MFLNSLCLKLVIIPAFEESVLLLVLSKNWIRWSEFLFFSFFFPVVFTPQPLRAVRVLFTPMVSDGQADGRREKVCLGCISETVRFRKLILGRDIG